MEEKTPPSREKETLIYQAGIGTSVLTALAVIKDLKDIADLFANFGSIFTVLFQLFHQIGTFELYTLVAFFPLGMILMSILDDDFWSTLVLLGCVLFGIFMGFYPGASLWIQAIHQTLESWESPALGLLLNTILDVLQWTFDDKGFNPFLTTLPGAITFGFTVYFLIVLRTRKKTAPPVILSDE